jgi:transposase-like protein
MKPKKPQKPKTRDPKLKPRTKLKLDERVRVLNDVSAGRITQSEAALALGCSVRQVRRQLTKLSLGGTTELLHKSIGKPGHNRHHEEVKSEVLRLTKEDYPDAGPTLLSDLLKERHGILINHETLRQWQAEIGSREIKTMAPRHRRRRARKAAFGIMEQMDTRAHDWLRQGINLYLIILVDDATSRLFARLYEHDSTMTNMDILKRYIERHGSPLLLYTDKAGHFRVNMGEKSEIILNPADKNETQIERALRECGCKHIHAHSPQAKGRVERAFGTLQDRLEKLFHYDGVKTVEEANEYLETIYIPKHNESFAVAPVASFDSHRPAGDLNLDAIFSVHVHRVVTNDFTFSMDGRKFQIARENDLRGLPRKKITIEKRLDGSVHARHMGRYLTINELSKKT